MKITNIWGGRGGWGDIGVGKQKRFYTLSSKNPKSYCLVMVYLFLTTRLYKNLRNCIKPTKVSYEASLKSIIQFTQLVARYNGVIF